MKRLEPSDIESLLRGNAGGKLIWFAGIGGCGMSGLAHLLLDLGFRVAGSDVEESGFVRGLRERDVEVVLGHNAEALRRNRPALVVYSPALRKDNPELQEALQSEIPIVCRAFLLAALSKCQKTLCIAGMHGKTTVASMLAYAMEQLDPDAGFAVGGMVRQLAVHARFSEKAGKAFQAGLPASGPVFAIEADESDGALSVFDPHDAILLNVDDDHLDYFASFENVCRQFSEFAARAKGRVIYSSDDTNLVSMMASQPGGISCGFNPLSDYRIESPEVGGRFELWKQDKRLGVFRTNLPGEKNINNTAMAAVWLIENGHAPARVSLVLRQFAGVRRRQERIYDDGSISVYDDYAHHPAEIMATIRAYQEKRPGRLITVFQPHRFSRTQQLMESFVTCFRQTDQLWLTEIYAAGEQEIEGVTGHSLARAIERAGQAVSYHSSPDQLRKALGEVVKQGDLVLFLGAGNLTHQSRLFGQELEERHAHSMDLLEHSLIEALNPEARIVRNEPMARKTTLRVGGPADLFVEPATENDLRTIILQCGEFKVPFFILGRGSNLLVRDGGFRGVVVHLKRGEFDRVQIDGDHVTCGAGVRLQLVAAKTREAGIEGFEWLEGIPGSIGGALRMNAGAMGSATFDRLRTLRVMNHDGEIRELSRRDVDARYRSCPMLKDHIALSATFVGSPCESAKIVERLRSYSEKRKASQPRESSAGCLFKNPPNIPAGKLVDEMGLKGVQFGNARVSDVHGNFIVNLGGASSQDVLNLIQYIKDLASEQKEIDLQSEVQVIGVDHVLSMHREMEEDCEREVSR